MLTSLPACSSSSSSPSSLLNRRLLLACLLAVLATTVIAPEACAGVGGAEFDDIYDKLVGYMQGTPGRIVMILAFIVAAIAAVVTQSLAGFAVGLGIGITVYYAQGLVDGVIVATLPITPPALTVFTPLDALNAVGALPLLVS